MRRLGLDFDIVPSGFDEDSVRESDNLRLVEKLAVEKARVVSKQFPEALVIGADSMVRWGNRLIGKPKNLGEARQMLMEFSGKSFEHLTGLAVVYQGKEHSTAVVERFIMKPYTEQEVEEYMSKVNPLDKAGGFSGAKGDGGELIESYEGEPGGELALPLNTLKGFLQEFGVKN